MFAIGAADAADALNAGLSAEPPRPESRGPLRHDDACANCGGGPVAQYCAQCGQRRVRPQDLTTASFLRESFHELTSLDGRLWRTMRVLLTAPGMLAREYFDGRGGRYMKPLSLFVLLNLVFFLIQPHTGLMRYGLSSYIEFDGDVAARKQDFVSAARLDRAMSVEATRRARGLPARPIKPESYEVFRARFDSTLQNQKQSLLIVSIPLLALAMVPLYARRRHRYAEHLVFSVHTYAFFLFFAGVLVTPLFIVTLTLLAKVGVSQSALAALESERSLVAVLFLVIGGYIYLGLRRMYGDSRARAALYATLLFAVMQGLIIVYHDALFHTTLASL